MRGAAVRAMLAAIGLLVVTSALGGEPRVNVQLRAFGVHAESGLATQVASAGNNAVVGGRLFASLETDVGRCRCTVAGVRGGGKKPISTELLATGQGAWIAEFDVLDASLSEIQVRANWKRLARVDGEWREEESVSEILSFRPGDDKARAVVPLDFVQESGADCTYRRLMIGVSAEAVEDPALAEARFEVDAWLEHVDDTGELSTRRERLPLGQGATGELIFESLRWPAPEAEAHEIIVDVSGQVGVRLQSDGSIEVAMDVERMVGVELAGAARRGGIGDRGRKTFQVVDGETVRMELPDIRQALLGLDSGPGHERRASASDGRPLEGYPVLVDAGAFLRGHHDALVLTVTRID